MTLRLGLTHVLLLLVVRYSIPNRSPVLRCAILGFTHFVVGWARLIRLLDFAGCHTVVRFMHVEERLCLIFKDARHGLTARFVRVRSRYEFFLKGDASTHAAFRLSIGVESMHFGLLLVQFFVVGRSRDHFLINEHLVSKCNSLSLWYDIVRHLLRFLLPVSLIRVFLRAYY